MRGHQIMRQTRALIEPRAMRSSMATPTPPSSWLKGALMVEAAAAQIGRDLVAHVNQWWREHLRQQMNLESAWNCSSKCIIGVF